MEPREILGTKTALLEQCNRERIANDERGGGARRGSEIVRTRLLAHPRIDGDVRVAAERGLRLPHQRESSYPEALEVIEQRDKLFRLAAFGDEDRDVLWANDAEIAVQRLD